MVQRVRTEPSAETLSAARQIHSMYVALQRVGFTDEQAMRVVLATLAGQQRKDEDSR